jgi:hypothetical protein
MSSSTSALHHADQFRSLFSFPRMVGNPRTGLTTGLGGENRCTIGNVDIFAVEMDGDSEATISRRRPKNLDDFDLVAGIRERPGEQAPHLNPQLVQSNSWLW